jgi:hypothetical protein
MWQQGRFIGTAPAFRGGPIWLDRLGAKMSYLLVPIMLPMQRHRANPFICLIQRPASQCGVQPSCVVVADLANKPHMHFQLRFERIRVYTLVFQRPP